MCGWVGLVRPNINLLGAKTFEYNFIFGKIKFRIHIKQEINWSDFTVHQNRALRIFYLFEL